MRRQLSGLRDSLVASSVWKPLFKNALQTYPSLSTQLLSCLLELTQTTVLHVRHMDFSVPVCDACHLGGRVSTMRARLEGKKYDRESFAVRRRRIPWVRLFS